MQLNQIYNEAVTNEKMTPQVVGILVGLIIIALLPTIIGIIKAILHSKKKKVVKEKITSLSANEIELTPEEFFNIRNFKGKRNERVGKYALNFNFEGVYIIYNETKNKYYVGQAKEVLNRVNNHFTGKGNGDVYADYKYGDSFKIKMISLEKSGYIDLNKLEYDTIQTYNAHSSGYNKTSGNKKPYANWQSQTFDDDSISSEYKPFNPEDDPYYQLSKDWNANKDLFKNEYKIAIEKIKKYALENNDWHFSNKNLRINFFYLKEEFYYKKPATWSDFVDKKIKYTNSPLSKSIIESIIEPIYLKSKNK